MLFLYAGSQGPAPNRAGERGMVWYFVAVVMLAVWVLQDAHKRENHVVAWPVAVLVLGPFVLADYFAERNLFEGENT